jgi:hypothetical protein
MAPALPAYEAVPTENAVDAYPVISNTITLRRVLIGINVFFMCCFTGLTAWAWWASTTNRAAGLDRLNLWVYLTTTLKSNSAYTTLTAVPLQSEYFASFMVALFVTLMVAYLLLNNLNLIAVDHSTRLDIDKTRSFARSTLVLPLVAYGYFQNLVTGVNVHRWLSAFLFAGFFQAVTLPLIGLPYLTTVKYVVILKAVAACMFVNAEMTVIQRAKRHPDHEAREKAAEDKSGDGDRIVPTRSSLSHHHAFWPVFQTAAAVTAQLTPYVFFYIPYIFAENIYVDAPPDIRSNFLIIFYGCMAWEVALVIIFLVHLFQPRSRTGEKEFLVLAITASMPVLISVAIHRLGATALVSDLAPAALSLL